MEEGGSEGKGVGAYIHSDLMDCKNDTTEHHHRDGTFNRLHLFIYLFIYLYFTFHGSFGINPIYTGVPGGMCQTSGECSLC